jgi:hypothetical protein
MVVVVVPAAKLEALPKYIPLVPVLAAPWLANIKGIVARDGAAYREHKAAIKRSFGFIFYFFFVFT